MNDAKMVRALLSIVDKCTWDDLEHMSIVVVGEKLLITRAYKDQPYTLQSTLTEDGEFE